MATSRRGASLTASSANFDPAYAPYVAIATFPPTELTFTTVHLLRSRAGSSAWVTAMCPEQVDLELPAPLGRRQRLDRGVDRDPGVVHHCPQRSLVGVSGHPLGQP